STRRSRSRATRAHHVEELLVQPGVRAELGVERDDGEPALAGGDGMAVDAREDLDARAVLLDPRRADEHRADRLALEVGEAQLLLEGVHLAAERVAPRDDVHDPEVLAVEHDEPGAGAEHRGAGRGELAQRVREALALDP